MNSSVFLGTVAAMYTPLVLGPGPCALLVSRASMVEGRHTGMQAALGITTGAFLWSALAAAGVGVMLGQWPGVIAALQCAGGAYLGWMGFVLVRSVQRPAQEVSGDGHETAPAQRAYWRGVATCMTNPQALVFFCSLFGALFTAEVSPLLRLASVLTVVGIALVGYLGQAALFAFPPLQRRYQASQRYLDGVCGVVFLLLGGRLLLQGLAA